MSSGKAPGVDSFMVAFFKLFGGILAPWLAKVFNAVLEGGSLPHYAPS